MVYKQNILHNNLNEMEPTVILVTPQALKRSRPNRGVASACAFTKRNF